MSALDTLLTHVEGERDQAAASLRRAEGQARRIELQMEQLQGYRGEYQQRWAGQFKQHGAMEIVHCYQSFSQRLEEALAQQQQQLDAAQAQCQRLRQVLLAAETRVASVRKLMERRQLELRRVQDRREQNETDENAQQIRWRARQGESTQH